MNMPCMSDLRWWRHLTKVEGHKVNELSAKYIVITTFYGFELEELPNPYQRFILEAAGEVRNELYLTAGKV